MGSLDAGRIGIKKKMIGKKAWQDRIFYSQ
jgi:hypothetical protein